MRIIERVVDLIYPPKPAVDVEKEAEARWAKRNEEKRLAGCPCGNPATNVRYDHRNMGSVPVEFWTCAEHVGVTSWTTWGNSQTYVPYDSNHQGGK